MSGFALSHGGDLTVDYGARRVLDTTGNLIMGLPSVNDYLATISVVFPDFTKDWLHLWRGKAHYNGGGVFALNERGDVYTTVPPQEWSAATILAAAPAGTNFLVSKVRLNRTIAPANTWRGQTIGVKLPQNKWIPDSGSMLVEAEFFMSRAFSLYVSGGNLILHRQQSISTGPGWANNGGGLSFAGTYMGYGGTLVAVNNGNPANQYQSSWAYGTAPGNIVYHDDGTQTVTGSYTEGPPTAGNPPPSLIGSSFRSNGDTNHGGNVPPLTDPTNYSSTYTVDVAVKFCRAT